MSVQDGTPVDAPTTNPAFLKPDVDDYTVSRLGAQRASSPSGYFVQDFQRYCNNIAQTIGLVYTTNYTAEADSTGNTYDSTSSAIANGDTFKTALTKLSNKFASTTGSGGHAHTGASGDGPQISALTGLTGINLLVAAVQVLSATSISGTSSNVTSVFTGRTSGGSSLTKGVVTAGQNYCELRNSSTDSLFINAQGEKVYGRITFAASTWTLTYYTLTAGVETSYNFTSPVDMDIYFLQVFDVQDVPTIWQDKVLSLFTQNPASDVSEKIGTNVLGLGFTTDSSTTGAGQSISPTKSIIRLTNASLTSINNIAAPTGTFQYMLVVLNGTGGALTITNNSGGTAANRIITGTGADLSLTDGASIWLFYDTTSTRWRVIGGSGGGGAGFGSANQLLGMNAAGTAYEFKTLSVGTSGTDFAIVQSVGDVAFNIPDAGTSTRGLITSGTQTLGGAKTFSSGATILSSLIAGSADQYTTTGTSNNVALGPTTYYNGAGPATFTGFNGGSPGKIIAIQNVSSSRLTVTYEDSGSSAANRITYFGSPTQLIIPTGGGAVFMYVVDRWRVIAASNDYYDPYTEVLVTTATNFPTSGQFGDFGSLALPPGDWDITFILSTPNNGSTTTLIAAGIGLAPGNNSSGLSYGDTTLDGFPPTAAVESCVVIPNRRVSISTTTTYYGKVLANYSAGVPKYRGRLSARRVSYQY